MISMTESIEVYFKNENDAESAQVRLSAEGYKYAY
jgi:hypothetical protein